MKIREHRPSLIRLKLSGGKQRNPGVMQPRLRSSFIATADRCQRPSSALLRATQHILRKQSVRTVSIRPETICLGSRDGRTRRDSST